MSTVVAEDITSQVVQLQGRNRLKAQLNAQQPNTQVVVGALVKSYCFNHVDGEDIAQGRMWLEFGARRIEVPVTVVILGGTYEDGQTGIRIVKETSKISDFASLVLDAHFSTYCERIGRYIVAYEPFQKHFHFNEEGGESFFADNQDGQRFQLAGNWALRMRQLIELLDYLRSRSVTHGGLSKRRSYVLSGGRIMLIDVARNTTGYFKEKDLTDLRSFIKEDAFFGGNLSGEWRTLDWLLGSNLVSKFLEGWVGVVLGHPILQLTAEDTLVAFRGVYTSKGQLTQVEQAKLANLLWDFWRELYENTRLPKEALLLKKKEKKGDAYYKRLKIQRKNAFRDQLEKPSVVIDGLFNYISPDKTILYGGEMVHLEMINLARNLIHHGASIPGMQRLDDKQEMLREVRRHFRTYLSIAYCFMEILEELDTDAEAPYECAAAATAAASLQALRNPTVWDIIDGQYPSE